MIIVGCVDYVLIPFEIELCIVQLSNAIVYQINNIRNWNEMRYFHSVVSIIAGLPIFNTQVSAQIFCYDSFTSTSHCSKQSDSIVYRLLDYSYLPKHITFSQRSSLKYLLASFLSIAIDHSNSFNETCWLHFWIYSSIWFWFENNLQSRRSVPKLLE